MDIIKKPINRDSIGFKLDLKVLRTYIDKKKSVSMKTGENPTMEILQSRQSIPLIGTSNVISCIVGSEIPETAAKETYLRQFNIP